MSSIESCYQDLTGVNIFEQKKLWDERGKGYYGEFLVFETLYQKLPGSCKILMNLQIPADFGNTTEIDLLLLHETGIYVFEVKHHKGTIYGKSGDTTWTQYFRTVENNTFRNPLHQNQYHIEAIRKIYPDVPIHSFVVFTSPECELNVQNQLPNSSVCLLRDLLAIFYNVQKFKAPVFDMSNINKLFVELKSFAPIMEENVFFDGQVLPFYQYSEIIKTDFENRIEQMELESKETKVKTRLTCFFIAILLLMVCFFYNKICEKKVELVQKEFQAFSQKFERVEEYNNGNIIISKDLIQVSDVVLAESVDVENAINFSCAFTYQGENYGVRIGENAKIIVLLKNGSVQEYDLWNETHPYSYDVYLSNSVLSNSAQLYVHEFYDIQMSDVSYIKLSNLGIFNTNTYPRKDIISNYEIELFSYKES